MKLHPIKIRPECGIFRETTYIQVNPDLIYSWTNARPFSRAKRRVYSSHITGMDRKYYAGL